MFDDVPEELTNSLRMVDDDFRGDSRDVAAAVLVAKYYLGLNFTDPKTSPFLGLQASADQGYGYEFHVRISTIAATLFELRLHPGFDELCRRLSKRDLRSTFFEAFAARQFSKANFIIEAREETGVKREDFDFAASRDGGTVNVEVTALTAPKFSHATVLNALNQKRKQLPDTHPAVIFCVVPEAWFSEDAEHMVFLLMLATANFYQRSRRVNWVVHTSEHHIETDDGSGLLVFRKLALNNRAARLPAPALQFLNTEEESATALRTTLESGVRDIPTMFKMTRIDEFSRWVDYAMSLERLEPRHGG